jgi:hypothetical protein
VSPEPAAAAAAAPALDLAGLRALHDAYTRAGVASQPDLLRELLAASYRSLQSARQAPVVAGLVRFVLHLPSPGDAGARLQLLAAKLLFEVSREPRNDALLLAIWPEVVSRVLARPAQTGLKGLSYALGALHNLSVEASSNSSGSAAQSPLVSQALVDALGNLLRPQVHRALKLPECGGPDAPASEEGVVKLLVEVTGALRNVASMTGAPALFCNAVAWPAPAPGAPAAAASAAGVAASSSEDSCLDLLCHVSQRHWAQGSLLLNVVRILAKLSLHQQCRAVMYAPTTLPPPLLPLSSAAAPAAPSTAAAPASGPTGFLPALVSALQVHHAKLSVCVRILYVLGNLTMQHDACRVAIADCVCACPAAGGDSGEAAAAAGAGEDRELRGWEVLLNLLARSYQRDSKLRKLLAAPAAAGAASGASTKPSSSATADATAAASSAKKHTTMLRENEELLVKLVRLLANLCINPQAGARIAGDRRVANLIKLLRVKSVETSEELVLNTVSAVTNLSFYLKPAATAAAAASRPASASAPSPSSSSAAAVAPAAGTKDSLLLFHPPRDVLALLLSNLFSANTELLSETLRCLGNFSRDLPFRLMMSQARADEAVLLLLHHGDCGVVYGAAGVVLNMAAHAGPGQEALWADQGAPLHALLDAMERFGGGDGDGDAAAEDDGDGDDAQDGEEEPEWGLLAMILKTFLNLRCSPPGETRSDSGSGSAAAPGEMVLRREVDAQVRAHLSYVLEAVLERCEAEVAALHAQLDSLVQPGGGGGSGADGDEDAPSPAALHAMLRVVGEVESLAQQLLPACIMPAPWQNDQ